MRIKTSQIVSKLKIDDLGITRTKAQAIIRALLQECKNAMDDHSVGNVNLPYLGTFKWNERNTFGGCKKAASLYMKRKITLDHAQDFIKYVYDREYNPKRLYLISRESQRFRQLCVGRDFGNPYALIPEEEESAHIANWRGYSSDGRFDTEVGTD